MNDKLIFLDNGATSYPKPEDVYVFMDGFYRSHGVNPGRSGYDLCVEAGQMVEGTRKMLAEFFHLSDPNRVCFAYNSTDALNLAIFGLVRPGDHVLTTNLEHNSVLRPLFHLAQEAGVEVEHLPFDERGFVDPDDFARRFRKNTSLVIVNHASNVIGTVQPIREIGRRCRERGVVFAIDASQSAGKVPIDMEADFLDVVCFTGHKSLLGPTGIGGLCVREGVTVRQRRAGGTGVRSAQRTHLEEYPYRLEYGTLNVMGVAGLHAGLEWIAAKGMATLHHEEMRLAKMLRDGLAAIDGVSLYCQPAGLENHIAVVPCNVDGLEAINTSTLLDVDHNIATRSGLHCAPRVHEQLGIDKIGGAVRFGIGPFNTDDHIRTAVAAIADIAEMQKRRAK
jgi:cysteine desulfurase/selenocysteine lyase